VSFSLDVIFRVTKRLQSVPINRSHTANLYSFRNELVSYDFLTIYLLKEEYCTAIFDTANTVECYEVSISAYFNKKMRSETSFSTIFRSKVVGLMASCSKNSKLAVFIWSVGFIASNAERNSTYRSSTIACHIEIIKRL